MSLWLTRVYNIVPSATAGITVPLAVLTNLAYSPWTVVSTSLSIAFLAILACRGFRQLKLQAMAFEEASMPTLATFSVCQNPAGASTTCRSMDPHHHAQYLSGQDGGYELTAIT